MASEALPILRQVVRALPAQGAGPAGLADAAPRPGRGRADPARRLARAAQPAPRPHALQLHIDLAHLKRVGDQLDRAANRLSLALVIAALIISHEIVMTVSGGPAVRPAGVRLPRLLRRGAGRRVAGAIDLAQHAPARRRKTRATALGRARLRAAVAARQICGHGRCRERTLPLGPRAARCCAAGARRCTGSRRAGATSGVRRRSASSTAPASPPWAGCCWRCSSMRRPGCWRCRRLPADGALPLPGPVRRQPPARGRRAAEEACAPR